MKRRNWALTILFFVSLFYTGCGSNNAPSTPAASSGPTYTYPFLYFFGNGTGGGTNGSFSDNSGIVVGNGAIFVADDNNNNIQKFDLNGNYELAFAAGGSPEGLAMDKYAHLYAAIFGGSVKEFDLNGNLLNTFTGTGTLTAPWDVKVDNALNIFVLDKVANLVKKLTQADAVTATSSGGTALSNPEGLAIDGNDNVYVSDFGNKRIVSYNSNLVYQREFGDGPGGATTITGEFYRPEGMVVDSDGNLLICDEGDSRIQKVSPTGTFLAQIGPASGSITLNCPFFIAADSNKNVYISDDCNYQIYKFAPY